MKTFKFGTPYFVDKLSAKQHNCPTGLKGPLFESCRVTNYRLNTGAIHIGPPPIKPGQKLSIEEGQYIITEVVATKKRKLITVEE